MAELSHFQIVELISGGLAQLARALDLHSRGQGFDSLILHDFFEITMYLRLKAEAKG